MSLHGRSLIPGLPSLNHRDQVTTGRIASGGSVTGGAAIVGGSVYWGSGYCGTLCLGGTTPVLNNNKVYAFDLG